MSVSLTHESGMPAQPATTKRARWSAVLAMSLCSFTLIASEFMPVSLLTPIAADLHVTEGQAGWGIGISGIFAVLTSLALPKLVGNIDRRTMLLAMTLLMGVSGAIVALATHYSVYMIGRALIGVVVGGFWSMSVAVAMRLVPSTKIPRAMAIFNGGNALATVLAAPLGSYLGALLGWRGVFWMLVPLAVITMIWQRFSLPALPPQPTAQAESAHRPTTNVFKLLASQRVVTLGMLACGLFFMGQFSLFTYVRPFLENVTQVADASSLSLILLVIGAAGVVGNTLIGAVLKRSLYGAIGSIPILMACIAVGLIGLGQTLSAVVLLLAVWGLIGTAAPVGWWSWLAKTLPHNAETGGALMVAVIQLAIGFGSFIGGVLFDGFGHQHTFLLSSGLLLAASFFCFITARVERCTDEKSWCRKFTRQRKLRRVWPVAASE